MSFEREGGGGERDRYSRKLSKWFITLFDSIPFRGGWGGGEWWEIDCWLQMLRLLK